jgi:hypothetical protein
MKSAFSVMTLVCFLFASGCGEDKILANGAIELSWAIGGSTCGAAGISLVEVTVYNAEHYNAEQIYSSTTVACELGKIQIPNIPAGAYSVRIDGIHQSTDKPIYEGSALNVEVQPNQVTVVPRINLTEKPGAIDLTWRFETGTLCSFTGVDTVDVSVWDIHSVQVWREILPCDPAIALVAAEKNEPIRALYTDAKGILIEALYAGSYTVEAQGLMAESGLPTWWAQELQVVVQHGKLTPVDLVLSPCTEDDVCL